MNHLFSDIVLFLHFSFVLFVSAGFIFILFSYILKLPSGRNYCFRLTHLCAVFFVTIQSWLGRICPLTILETLLRSSAGKDGYRSSFMEYWVEKLIYYDFPFHILLQRTRFFFFLFFSLCFISSCKIRN